MKVRGLGQPIVRSARNAMAASLPPVRSERPLWLFGGASGRSYSDNSRATHERLLATRQDVEPVWVIDEDSTDLADVQRAGRHALRGTVEAHRLARSAQVIVFSHGVQDVPGTMWGNDAVRVRLGHGLTAFGRTKGRTPRSVERMTRAVDLAPVASELEQDHKAEWGFPRHKLPITGLPRWDAMLAERAATSEGGRRPLVFYAPTSRPWHTAADASPEGALKPVYELLSSPGLREQLADGAFDLAVYFHQITRFRFGTFDWLPPEVQVIEQEAVLPHLIATASLVVSDYSSILWDALYLDTPVIFFQFDRHEHVTRRGSYLDLGSTLFGPNCDSPSQVQEALDQAVSDGFTLEPWRSERARWQERAFAYRDAHNADRVLAAITARLEER